MIEIALAVAVLCITPLVMLLLYRVAECWQARTDHMKMVDANADKALKLFSAAGGEVTGGLADIQISALPNLGGPKGSSTGDEPPSGYL